MTQNNKHPFPDYQGGRGHIKYDWSDLERYGDSKFWPVPEGRDSNLFRNVLRRSAQSRAKDPFEIATETRTEDGVLGIRTWRKS